jgi:DNA-binding NarL/FixJ family response regulator
MAEYPILHAEGRKGTGGAAMVEQQRIRVIIADARQDVREALAALLDASDDFEVVCQAATPAEAADCAALLAPDLVVLEPTGESGCEAYLQLSRLSCPLVLLTLNITPECRARALELGVVAVLDKGTSPEELLGTLRRAVRSSRSRDTLRLRSA